MPPPPVGEPRFFLPLPKENGASGFSGHPHFVPFVSSYLSPTQTISDECRLHPPRAPGIRFLSLLLESRFMDMNLE